SDLDLAWEYLRRALSVYEKRAPDSLESTYSRNNLINVALARGKPGDLRRAAAYAWRNPPSTLQRAPPSPDLADCWNALGNVAYMRGDRRGARRYFRRDLELTRSLAPGSRGEALSLGDLGDVALDDGDSATAEGYLRRALA